MSLGISIDFHPGPDGHWRQLYLVDVFAHCPSCGCEAVERYYRDVAFHSLTLPVFRALAGDAWRGFAATCSQCSDRLGDVDVRAHVMHWGFADGRGLIQAYGSEDGTVAWVLAPHRYFDVQANLERTPREDISVSIEHSLSDDALMRVFGRVFNPKEHIRRLIQLGEIAESRMLGPGLEVHVRSGPPRERDGWVSARLDTDEELSCELPGRAAEWLSDLLAGTDQREVSDLGVYVSSEISEADAAIRRHVERFPIDVAFHSDGDRLEVRAADTPEDPLVFDLRRVAIEAALTASLPGDIARLELDRALLCHTAWSDELNEDAATDGVVDDATRSDEDATQLDEDMN